MKISTEEIQKNIEGLTLSHMLVAIDFEQLLLDDYPYAERDLAIALVQGYYQRFQRKLEKDLQTGQVVQQYLLQRALDHSRWYAIRRLTTEFHGLVDRATTFMLDDAEQTGWYRQDYFGYDSLEELLASVADEQEEASSSWYDWTFIAKTLTPFARSIDLDPSTLMSASCQIRKFRGIVPAARETLKLMENGSIDRQTANERIAWMLEQVADPRVSSRNLSEALNEMRGKQVHRAEPIKASKFILPENRTWIVIPCADLEQERVIELALRNLVDIRLSNIGDLLSAITGLVKNISDEELNELYGKAVQ